MLCVRCDVSPARMPLFTVCVMRCNSAKRKIWGGLHIPAGGHDCQIRTRPRFLCNAPTPKFHHPMFTRSEVIVLTHKQTDKPTNKQAPPKTSNVLAMLRHWVIIRYSAWTASDFSNTHRYGDKSFCISGPDVWNKLPSHLQTVNIRREQLV